MMYNIHIMINEVYTYRNFTVKVLSITLNTKEERFVTYLRDGKEKKMRLSEFKRIFTKVEAAPKVEIQKPQIDWTEAFEPELGES